MSERASNLVGGICGLAAVAPLIGGFPFTGATPEPGASPDDVAEYLSRSSAQMWTGICLEFFGLALFIVFVGRLWALLREAEGAGGWIATTALGAALAALTSHGRRDDDGCRLLGRPTRPRPRRGRRHVQVQWYADLAFGAVNAVFCAAASVLVLRYEALPTWLGWFALVVAVALVVTVPFGPGSTMEPPHVLGFLWVVSVSVLMIVWRDALPARS